MRRRGKNKHHHVATLNIVELAMRRVRKLARSDVDAHRAIARDNLAVLVGSEANCAERLMHLKSLADMANLSQTLAKMGLGSGALAVGIIERAQAALAAIAKSGPLDQWRADADQAEAIEWLIALHCEAQLAHASYGEFEDALKQTHQRVQQALAGNAGKADVVVPGEIGTRELAL